MSIVRLHTLSSLLVLATALWAGCDAGTELARDAGLTTASDASVDAAPLPIPDAGRECIVAECEAGSALTCDRQLGLDCTSFGAVWLVRQRRGSALRLV